jgi:hypothetical protein
MAKAKSFADRTMADARSEAEQLLFEARTHAEVTKQTAEREVSDLTRQRDTVTAQLNQLREMLSGLAGAVPTVPAKADPVKADDDDKSETNGSTTSRTTTG